MSSPSGIDGATELESRYAWLAAMGIPLWLPRESLPGGPETQTVWRPRSAGQEKAVIRTLAPQHSASPGRSEPRDKTAAPRRKHDVAAVLDKISAPATPESTGSKQARAIQSADLQVGDTIEAPRSDRPIRFGVDVRVGAGWMLLAEHGSGYWGERERLFAADLMFACCGEAKACSSGPTFHWPPKDHERLESRADLARDALAGFIEKCAADCELHSLLCVGSSLSEWLIEAPEEERIALRGLAANVRRVALPGVQDMLEHPASKRRVWQILSELAHGS